MIQSTQKIYNDRLFWLKRYWKQQEYIQHLHDKPLKSARWHEVHASAMDVLEIITDRVRELYND